MNPFLNKQCREYSQPENVLNLSEIQNKRQHTPFWQFCADENLLSRTFQFTNFTETMAFVNKVAEIAEQQDHHPEIHLSYQRCKVSYSTHSVNGITENDFICASLIDEMHAQL